MRVSSLKKLNRTEWISALLCSALVWNQPFISGPRIPSLILAIVGIYLWIQKDRFGLPLERRKLFLLWLLMWLPGLISLPGSYNPDKSFYFVVLFPLFFFVAIALYDLLKSEKVMQLFEWLIVFACVVWIAAAIFEYLLRLEWSEGMGLPAGLRITGAFENLRGGLFITVLLPIVLYKLDRFKPWVQIVYLGLVLWWVVLSGVRTDLWSWILIVTVYYLMHPYRKKVILIAAGLLVAMVLVMQQLSPVMQSKVQASIQEVPTSYKEWNKTLSYRPDIWSAGLNMFQAYPWRGVGVLAFEEAYDEHKIDTDQFDVASGHRPFHAHHPWISIIAETGLFGVFGFVLIIALLLRWTKQAFNTINLTKSPYLLSFLIMLFPIHSMHPPYTVWWFPALLMVMVVHLLKTEQQRA